MTVKILNWITSLSGIIGLVIVILKTTKEEANRIKGRILTFILFFKNIILKLKYFIVFSIIWLMGVNYLVSIFTTEQVYGLYTISWILMVAISIESNKNIKTLESLHETQSVINEMSDLLKEQKNLNKQFACLANQTLSILSTSTDIKHQLFSSIKDLSKKIDDLKK